MRASISLVAVMLIVTACQGQNPFTPQRNPVRNYPDVVAAANRPFVPVPTPPAPTAVTLPNLVFNDLPKNKISFGQSVKFQILVNDPNSNSDNPPVINWHIFQKSVSTTNKPVYDASSGIDCDYGDLMDGSTTNWQFNCTLSTSNIKNIDSQINSGKSYEYLVFATASSARITATTLPIASPIIRIEFPAVSKGAKE